MSDMNDSSKRIKIFLNWVQKLLIKTVGENVKYLQLFDFEIHQIISLKSKQLVEL